MKPVELSSSRLTLDQLTVDDVPALTEYCNDPVFERYLTTPWPYTEANAVDFITAFVPDGWRDDREFTWALRAGGEFVGVVGFRAKRGDIGFWVGAPHRGNGYMTEAVTVVCDWLFQRGFDRVEWFAVVGNTSSAEVARKCGFTYVGERPSPDTHRGPGDHAAWFGVLAASDDRTPKVGWPHAS
jgi:RimJ/RimL family protein N-acetyltransferase